MCRGGGGGGGVAALNFVVLLKVYLIALHNAMFISITLIYFHSKKYFCISPVICILVTNVAQINKKVHFYNC